MLTFIYMTLSNYIVYLVCKLNVYHYIWYENAYYNKL